MTGATVALFLLAVGYQRYPNLHTILDTASCVLAGVLALLLWDIGRRTPVLLASMLGLCFGATFLAVLLHLSVSFDWFGRLAWIGEGQSDLRPSTWPVALYLLAGGVAFSLGIQRLDERGLLRFAIALVLIGALGTWLIHQIPRYTEPFVLGITRPAVIGVPLLWIAVSAVCWRRRGIDRLYPMMGLTAVTMAVANIVMLYSRSATDSWSMASHVLIVAAFLSLIFLKLRAATDDTRARIQAERELTELNAELERRVSARTAELQQAYDDLRLTQQKAMQQERLRALGQMASGIAHDINNAISPIALYTEALLEREPGVSESGRGYLRVIQRAIDDVVQTVARMREFYRVHPPTLELKAVNLNEVARQVLDITRARWSNMPQEQGLVIQTRLQLADDLPLVLGVESEIREAFINLVLNAVDAMTDGGTLTLRTGIVEGSQDVFAEVRDTGHGMDDETRRRCFEPFFTTKGERGTGLGLAMVYGTVQRHGAQISIDSMPGTGTTIRIAFSRRADAAYDDGSNAPLAVVLPRLRLLVIDDDPLLLKSLRDILESDGHQVTTAGSGHEGVEAFRARMGGAEPFAAVITDLGMPHMDGRQVALAIKAISAATPVILLTGWGQRLLDDGELPQQVDEVLGKPPKLRALREALSRVIG